MESVTFLLWAWVSFLRRVSRPSTHSWVHTAHPSSIMNSAGELLSVLPFLYGVWAPAGVAQVHRALVLLWHAET